MRDKTGTREREERDERDKRDKREKRDKRDKKALVRSFPTIRCDPYSHRESKTSQDTERTRQANTTQDTTSKTHVHEECTRQETRDMSTAWHVTFWTNP